MKSGLGEGATRACLAQPVWWHCLPQEVMVTAPGTLSRYLHITHQSMKFLPNSKKKPKQSKMQQACWQHSWHKFLEKPRQELVQTPGEGEGGVWPRPCPTSWHGERSAKQHGMVSAPPVAIRQPCPHLHLSSVLVEGRRQGRG